MTRQLRDVYIVDAVRTPVSKYGGALSGVRPDDLAAGVLRSLLKPSPSATRSAPPVPVSPEPSPTSSPQRARNRPRRPVHRRRTGPRPGPGKVGNPV